jgi:outer membrane immunogenic protein
MQRLLVFLFFSLIIWLANPRFATADPGPNWAGFYIGGNAGGGWSDQQLGLAASDPTLLPFNLFTLPFEAKMNTSSLIGGLQLGYNSSLGANWLIGFETDFNWSNLKASTSLGSNVPALVADANERLSWFGTIRARLGYFSVERFLLYATGGFAYGRLEANGNIVNNSGAFGPIGPGVGVGCSGFATCFSGSSKSTATGWTLGGGFEYEFWRRMTFKVEYLYVNLGSHSTVVGTITPPNGSATFTAMSDTTFNIVRAGINYRL